MAIKKTTLSLLTKAQLIEIITSDTIWEHKAFHKVLKMVGDKVNEIIDKQEKCDFSTMEGRLEYMRLEKEYKKWSDIHANL